jgi:predicted AlkP superfamily pyrophosphatase or phosphodiesterase
MNRGPNIFDFLEKRNIPYHVSAPQKNEQQNLRALISDIRAEKIDFAFLYWPALDGLLHSVGNQSPLVPEKLRGYEKWIRELLAVAEEHYAEVRVYIFSDHGMANCDELLDLKSKIEPLPLRLEKDYAVVYDSTMARFWFFNERAREQITAELKRVPNGRILPDAELKRLRAHFPDHYFGELIFLTNEGVLIVPSHMGERPIRGMHGYHPEAKHSYAMLCTNQPDIPPDVAGITDIFRLMTHDAEVAVARNSVSEEKEYEGRSLARSF